MATQATANQIRFAYLLLRYLHGNVNNVYLLLGIVAWARAEGGGYLDPLNIKAGNFTSIDAAARATAARLLTRPQYSLIVKVARRSVTGVEGMQEQALDLLHAAALSGWDEYMYGGRHKTYGPYQGWMWTPYDPEQNSLIKIWAGLLGYKVTIPSDVLPKPPAQNTAPQRAPKPPPPPRQPDRRVPPLARGNYTEPYAAQGFYEGRPHGGRVIDV